MRNDKIRERLTSDWICDIRIAIGGIIDDGLPTTDHLHGHLSRREWDFEFGHARSDGKWAGRATTAQDHRGRPRGIYGRPHRILFPFRIAISRSECAEKPLTVVQSQPVGLGRLSPEAVAPAGWGRAQKTMLSFCKTTWSTEDEKKRETNSNSGVASSLERGDVVCRQVKPRGMGKIRRPRGTLWLITFDRAKANTQN